MADRKPLCDSTEHLPPAAQRVGAGAGPIAGGDDRAAAEDRKSTRLNSSHSQISYAVFCLKKKKTQADAIANQCGVLAAGGLLEASPAAASDPSCRVTPSCRNTITHRVHSSAV